MQPPSSWPATTTTTTTTTPASTPLTPPTPSRRPPPQPEFQCHHADCLRRFVRKTSLTNHLKAHQNIRSRSIYRTKRARLRAAAAMQAAAANAAATDPASAANHPPSNPANLPPQQQNHYPPTHPSHFPLQQNQYPPYRATHPIPQHSGRDSSVMSRRTDSSPISTASRPSSPSPHHVISSHPPTAQHPVSSTLPDSAAPPHDAPTSLVSPNSFTTHPLETQDNSAFLFTKAFDMSVQAPSWGINHAAPSQDPYHPAMLPFVPHRQEESHKLHQHHSPNAAQQHVAAQAEPLPIVSHVEPAPNVGSAGTPMHASSAVGATDILPPQTDLFPEVIEPLHPYEFLGDFGSYN